jgi:hypothetical protein
MMRRGLDESDLTQLSRVNLEMEMRLKGMGYSTLWQIAFAEVNILAEEGRVSIRTAERMIGEAKSLLGMNEDKIPSRLVQDNSRKTSGRARKYGVLFEM